MARASAPAVCPWKYHVFLSFRGEDTRRCFTDHLYKQLEARGIKTFRDEPELERGTDINPELLKAIDQSRSAIIVLSTNYASSSWCLRELTHIVRCMKEKKRIFPIFYGVDPSDVRHQRGGFGEAFAEHEVNYREHMEEVNEWRKSLKRVANLAGWNSKDCRYDTELIQGIVNTLWKEVHPTLSMLDSSERFVGIVSKLKEIDLILDTDANDVRFIGIRGMGGVGKTTLARLVYERISHDFEGSSFLANVREVCSKDGIAHLQKQLLSEILGENNIQIWNAYSGITRISRCLCNKKVLLILDDVDQLDQLEKLVKQKEWFGFGSRIVVTTRDERLLVEHGIEMVYEVKPLTQDEALFLFSRKAFKDDELEEDFLELSKCIISYASGLPLALETLGSFLYKRGRDEWKSALEKLKQAPHRTIFETLKISYDGLDEFERRIFLDIACFHKFGKKKRVIESLENCGFVGARIVIEVLIEKSLLYISFESLSMHDLIQEMAWEIVRLESYDEPGGRSRLWLPKDILRVLAENTGSEAIEGIVLHLNKFEGAHCNPEAFTKMCKLRLLHIHHVSLSEGPKYLPNSLRELKWSWYPSKCLPPTFQPDELTELSLRHSKIDHLWDGIKRLGKLKSIDLSYSHNLTRTPDFTGIQNLEELVLEGCTNLAMIHSSIAFLRRLRILNLKDCKSIKSLPDKVEMESLEVFDISGYSKVKKIPEFAGIQNLEELVLEGCTNLVEIHLSIAFLKRLRLLNLKDCKSVKNLPNKVEMESLEIFDISGCSTVKKVPEFVGEMNNFTKLSLSGTGVQEIPSSVIRRSLEGIDLSGIALRETESSLVSVKNLVLSNIIGCNAPPARSWRSFFTFGEFPAMISHPASVVLASLKDLCFLKELNLKNCNICEGAIPDNIGFLSSLERLNLSGNHFVSLPASIAGLSKLKEFRLENCKRLQQLPTLPLNGFIYIYMDNCTSLNMLPNFSHACRLSNFKLRCINCFSLAGNQGSDAIMYSLLKRFIQGYHFDNGIMQQSILIPGSEIPPWFNNQSMGDSVIAKLPSHFCNSKVVGFALCALIVPAELKKPRHCRREISFTPSIFSNNTFQEDRMPRAFAFFDDVASDHLWMFSASRIMLYYGAEKCGDQIRFRFWSRYLKVKKCGVRPVYVQERIESRRVQPNDETTRGIKRTPEQYSNEAGPSESGSSSKRVEDQVEEA